MVGHRSRTAGWAAALLTANVVRGARMHRRRAGSPVNASGRQVTVDMSWLDVGDYPTRACLPIAGGGHRRGLLTGHWVLLAYASMGL